RHKSNIVAEARQRIFAYGTAIQKQLAVARNMCSGAVAGGIGRLVGVVENPWDQAYKRSFSRTGRSKHGQAGGRWNCQVDILEYLDSVMAETEIAKFQVALHRARLCQIRRDGIVGDVRLGFKKHLNAPHGSHAALEDVDHPAQSDHRPGEHDDVDV